MYFVHVKVVNGLHMRQNRTKLKVILAYYTLCTNALLPFSHKKTIYVQKQYRIRFHNWKRGTLLTETLSCCPALLFCLFKEDLLFVYFWNWFLPAGTGQTAGSHRVHTHLLIQYLWPIK